MHFLRICLRRDTLPSLRFSFQINPLYLFGLYICRLKGQEVLINGVLKHCTSSPPLVRTITQPEVAPPLLSHTASHATVARKWQREGKFINDSIHKSPSGCQRTCLWKINAQLCAGSSFFVVWKMKFDMDLADTPPHFSAQMQKSLFLSIIRNVWMAINGIWTCSTKLAMDDVIKWRKTFF